jgi:hypothetical protein
MSNNNVRIENLQVSTFLQDRPGSHDWTANQSRPCLGTNLYNGTDEAITITIPAKSRAYLPGQFDNSKYGGVEAKLTKTHATFKIPIGKSTPAFNSGKPKS